MSVTSETPTPDMDAHRPLSQPESHLPVSKKRIFSFNEVQEGDYLAGNQHYVHHYLVVSVSDDRSSCIVIESWRKMIQRKTLDKSVFQDVSSAYYKVNYDPQACIPDTESVIEQAECLLERRRRTWEARYSRKRFVHFMKTGRAEDADININDLCDALCDKEAQPGKAISVVPLNPQPLSKCSLKEGDHIISSCASSSEYSPVYRSHIIVDIDRDKDTIKALTLKGSLVGKVGIVEEEVNFREIIKPHKVEYSSSLSPTMAVKRAKERFSKQSDDIKETFHSWNNNSHLFVSWCKTGEEDSLTDVLKMLRDKEEDNVCYPVFFKIPVETTNDFVRGDHLICKSEHYLVQNFNALDDTFDAYTTCRNRCILKKGMKMIKGSYKVDYGDFYKIRSREDALKSAKDSIPSSRSWKHSSEFVTEMKCSVALFIDERCLIDNDISLSCTSISPNRLVNVGDHLTIKVDGSAEFHSALVYKCIGQSKFLITPPLPQTDSDEIDLSSSSFTGEAYRIDYPKSLPQIEVVKRARCKAGMTLSKQKNSWDYVTWAKVGKSLPVIDIPTMTHNDCSVQMEVNRNVHQYYERISSLSEIQKGDHIFVNHGLKRVILYRKHMLVTECTDDPTVFKVAFCLKARIQEADMDLKGHTVYRVKYAEELSVEDAVKRAWEKVGEYHLGPLDRLWFVPWCKANSDSVEVSLLPYQSNPKSKSQISSFTQLNPGDYLVEQSRSWNHHYLVLSIESPNQCTVCESRRRMIRKVNLRMTDDSQVYYRINYKAKVCFKSERSVAHAKALLGTWDLRILTNTSRQRFVHYLKTGEDAVVNVTELPDDHLMSLELECIVSLSQLKRGDHLCQPIGSKVLRLTDANHHMIVDELRSADNNQLIKVIHYQVFRRRFQKGALVNEEMNVFDRGELYRIPYPDRIDPQEAIEKLKNDIRTNQNNDYNLFSNNCEHVVTGAITGVAFSTQVEKAISKLIRFSRSSLKYHMSKLASHGSRDVAIHSSSHKAAARIVIKSSMIKSAVITGGVTLAVAILMDYPLLLRRIYKLYRQRKFNAITEVEMKREVTKAIVEFGAITVFSLVGVVVGQLFIPVPLVGGLIGGLAGILVGHVLGRFVGWLVSKMFREKRPTSLPMIVHKQEVRSPW